MTGSPAGLSRVIGVRRSCAKLWNCNPSPFAKVTILTVHQLISQFGVGDNIMEVISKNWFRSV